MAGIFSRLDMDTKIMQEGHLESTLDRCKASKGDYLVVAQDTCTYTYSGHLCLEGIGNIQGNVKGFLQHNVLVMDEKGLPLGLLGQEYWTRSGSKDLQPLEGETEKPLESKKWLGGLSLVNEQLKSVDKQVVLVQDREADSFEFLRAKREENVDFVVRVFQARNFEYVPTGFRGKLPEIEKKLSDAGRFTLKIRRNNKDVEVTYRLSYGNVHLLAPKDAGKEAKGVNNLNLVVAEEVDCREIGSNESIFKEDEASKWVLLSSLPLESAEDARRIVHFYSLRWTIERFHYTLKSGALNVEKLQFDDIHTLLNAVAFYSIVAWKLLTLNITIKQNPLQPAIDFVSQKEIDLLQKVKNKKIKTIGDFVLTLARIVNFVPTKKQPYPGVKILAEAIQAFFYIKIGAGLKI